jgi:hypothetical protein
LQQGAILKQSANVGQMKASKYTALPHQFQASLPLRSACQMLESGIFERGHAS